MSAENKPLVYLLNTETDLEEKLQERKFNVSHYRLNGIEEVHSSSYTSFRMPYVYEFPTDLHEAEIVVIDTELSGEHIAVHANEGVPVLFRTAQDTVNFLPLDMYFLLDNIYSTGRKQCIIIFCHSNDTETYEIEFQKGTKTFNVETYNFQQQMNIVSRHGTRIEVINTDEEKNIKDCLKKHLKDSEYNITFHYNAQNDIPLLQNDAGNVVAKIRKNGEKICIFLPVIADKDNLLIELFEKVLPEHPDFSDLFPNNGNFEWVKDFSYISIDERNKIIDIENEIDRHKTTLVNLEEEFEEIHNKDENFKLRSLLKETGDDLVYAVKWFLEYLGFTGVVNPDEQVNEENGDLFEEDLNFEYDGLHFILEVKGIGGTSTDNQCSQISKIQLRRKKKFPTNTYKPVYIVNHQRYKAPKIRQALPFTPEQIENAEMTSRGMTFTYELFEVYHLIENGILKKENVREAFKEDGVIDFRRSLIKLSFNTCFKSHSAYSFTLDEKTFINKLDKIAIKDNQEHWHLLDISNIQVNSENVEEATDGKVAIKVPQLIEGARDYYLVKQ